MTSKDAQIHLASSNKKQTSSELKMFRKVFVDRPYFHPNDRCFIAVSRISHASSKHLECHQLGVIHSLLHILLAKPEKN